MKYHGNDIPLEVYHGVPKGWYAHEILSEHARLGGTFDISGPEATEPGAPCWMPERRAWLQYRATLYRVGDGVAAKDPACIELAIQYIELRYIGSYSGFVRSLFSRRLKHVPLRATHQIRLHEHFRILVLSGERSDEFRDYMNLWRLIVTDEQRKELFKAVSNRGTSAVSWLTESLQPNKLIPKNLKIGGSLSGIVSP